MWMWIWILILMRKFVDQYMNFEQLSVGYEVVDLIFLGYGEECGMLLAK